MDGTARRLLTVAEVAQKLRAATRRPNLSELSSVALPVEEVIGREIER